MSIYISLNQNFVLNIENNFITLFQNYRLTKLLGAAFQTIFLQSCACVCVCVCECVRHLYLRLRGGGVAKQRLCSHMHYRV